MKKIKISMNLIRLGGDLCSRLHVGGDTANMAVATSFKPYGIPSKNTISYTMNLTGYAGTCRNATNFVAFIQWCRQVASIP